jgi:C-terminal processing protease CtpA/Prc
MNLVQSLSVAAAALVMSLSIEGLSPARAVAQQTSQILDRAGIRHAVQELANLMERNYVAPDIAAQYAARLRERLSAGAYDTLGNPAQLADSLEADLNAVHRDAHLRVDLAQAVSADGRRIVRGPAGPDAFGQDRWLADGVAYLRIDLLPGEEDVGRMSAILDRYENANALIIDLRNCRGGTQAVMDVVLSRLFAEPTEFMLLDTRPGATPEIEAGFEASATMHRERVADNVTRFVHTARPTAPVSSLADARVFVLTGATASACEHLALGLKQTGRATLVGGTTRGAGHYGNEQLFADGRLQVWLPVGRSFVRATGQGWEGAGIAPNIAAPPADALNVALRELGVAQVASPDAVAAPAPTRRVEATPGRPGYGIAMLPPRGGEASIEVREVIAGRPAAAADVRPGDRILSLNGAAVASLTPEQFAQHMRGSPLRLVVERGGEQLTFTLSLD